MAVRNVRNWLSHEKYRQYRSELESMIDSEQWQEIEDAFFKNIEFGTGGRRGTTGIGSNRINRVTIGESAQALCAYAASFYEQAPKKGIVIACDTRLSSPELSRFTAQVCAAAGFKTYIFDSFRSTPELSFAVRHLGCAAGIVISASHNPPSDNGFKAYWSDGAQLVAPHDNGVLAMAAEIQEIQSIDFETAVSEGNITLIGKDVDEAYIAAAASQSEGVERDISIVYSPLHGAGQTNVLPVLQRAGFRSITTVAPQMIPDGSFPTIPNGKPNPEEKSANVMAVQLMLKTSADIAITNDPDADRIGVVVNHHGTPIYLSGNQSAVLAADYALSRLKDKQQLTSRHYLAKTIVTTDMLNAVADTYGIKAYGNMLIGFKYIGELIRQKESSDEIFVLGCEESFGLLKGDYTRDKDGATGALPLAEYAAELKKDDKDLYDRLLELFGEHGCYVESLDNVQFPGSDGFKRMQKIMQAVRSSPPQSIGDHHITALLDYKTLERTDTKTNEISQIDCINGDVVVLECGDKRRRITIRPSGTEPKLKVYIQWYEQVNAESNIETQYEDVKRYMQDISQSVEALLLS